MTEKNIDFKVNCRECGKPMHKASSLLQTTLFCSEYKLKATIIFEKQSKVELKRVNDIFNEIKLALTQLYDNCDMEENSYRDAMNQIEEGERKLNSGFENDKR